MKRILAGAAIVALALAPSGCAASFDSSHLGVTVTMAEPVQAPAAGAAFRVTKHPVYLVMGLISLGQGNLEDVLTGQLGPGRPSRVSRSMSAVAGVTCWSPRLPWGSSLPAP